MDERYVKYIWIILNNAVQEIQKENAALTHEEIYHKAYEVVMNKHGFRMYNGLRELLTDHLKQQIRPELLENLNLNFLPQLHGAWIKHQTAMLMLRDMLGFMDRTYAEPRGLDNVYNLGLKIFRDEIIEFVDIKTALVKKLLDMINEERLGGKINDLEIKNACTMLITLGINSRYFYEQIFEIPFLLQTADFYETESHKLLKENSINYISKMKCHITNETIRAGIYLHKDTEPRIVKMLEEIVEKHKPDNV